MVDHASILATEAEKYAKDPQNIDVAIIKYGQASFNLLEAMANYKQLSKERYDESTYQYLKVLAEDYKKSQKLLKSRKEHQTSDIRNKVAEMQRAHQEKVAKAKRDGVDLETNTVIQSNDKNYDDLCKKMQQQMLLIDTEVLQQL